MEHEKKIDIHQFLNFNLSSDEEKEFKSTVEYKKHQEILNLFDNIQAVPIDEKTLWHAINTKKTVNTKVIPLYKKWWPFSAAASILICCSVFFFYATNSISHDSGIGESIEFSLPDESLVWLNAKSEISYNKDWENARDIILNGEAYFEVAKGKKFTVKTSEGIVTVLGTKFNVKQRDAFFEVHCFEGSVAVTHNTTKTILKPNDVFTTKGTKIKNIKKPNWIRKESVFYNSSLHEVITDISLHYNIQFKKNKNIDNLSLKYTGSYHYSDDLHTVLDVLCKSLDLNYRIKNKHVYLSTEE